MAVPDLIAVVSRPQPRLVVFRVDPFEGFADPTIIELIGGVSADTELADLDQDGFIDLVARNADAEGLSVYFGQTAKSGELGLPEKNWPIV